MTDKIDDPVPKGPPDLCFESTAFTEEWFSVDRFLQEHRSRGDLETMRDDLGIYLKVLRSATIDLVDKDYADYVALSGNLVGLDKALASVHAPLAQLREELLQVKRWLDEAVFEATTRLEKRRALRERRRAVRSLNKARSLLKERQCSSNNDQLSNVERAVSEFSQLQVNANRCIDLMTPEEKQALKEAGERLCRDINTLFLESLSAGEAGRDQLAHCLAFYLRINRQPEVERLYGKEVVGGALEDMMSKGVSPTNLDSFYDRILAFIDVDVKHLLYVTSNWPGLENYDFLVRSLWPEVERRLRVDLSSIRDAGDPDAFHKRYSATLRFLGEFEKRLVSEESRRQWKRLPGLSAFLSGWNLPVYFQIRFQEIVKGVEKRLSEQDFSAFEGVGDWELAVSGSLWDSLLRCWSPNVFLLPVADKFWKMTLQILARYLTWVKITVQQKNPSPKDESGNGSGLLVLIYRDVESLIAKLPQLRDLALSKMPSVSITTKESLTKSLEESGDKLKGELSCVEGGVVKWMTTECSSSLRQVSDIPRLFRRTNREAPTRPCAYVAALLGPPVRFHAAHSQRSPSLTASCLRAVFSDLTKQYFKLVSEVLTSVQKTEESLRRLKKARDHRGNTPSHLNPVPPVQRSADDDKIRLQLYIDVTAYSDGVRSLGVNQNEVEQLGDLVLLVETTKKL